MSLPADKLARLTTALADYDAATFGALNRTAEALREAAKACGWTWSQPAGGPVAFARRIVSGATPE